jgi:sugar/nucleoside kinase (ribokinase family)
MEWDAGVLDVLPHVDLFLPNLVEAQEITQTTSAETALEALALIGNIVVIKMGAAGCLVRHREIGFHAPAFEVEVVDVTSAGDVFNAGFLYGFLAGWELERVARFANACGAIAVSQVGSAGIISGVAQVEEFITCQALGEALY